MKVLDYILNRANVEEIKGIEMALDRRRSEQPAGVADLDFQKMASQMAGKLGHSLDFDVKGMSKRLVVEMILQQYPNISDEELQAMLDQFVPDEAQRRNEGLELPRELRISMLDQFIRYSVGRMPADEQNELKRASPDWVQRYWSAFSPRHRALLGQLLKGEIDSDDFWREAEGI
ncbi:MAG: hypothetical protein CVV45_17445 [Spirochaetae bacterium HGW-Spirochaetae-10]|nr:MAG: hypothetical protein CVV45_17445 [Spirochaetae bacterium HGW-Spirochaetae-10]